MILMSSSKSSFLRRKLPTRWAGILMPLVLSVMMTCVISGIVTLLGFGLSAEFLRRWPVSWGASWLVAFPTLLLVLPVVRRVVGLLVEMPAPR